MKQYDVKCPVCGHVNHNLFLDETDGWMETGLCPECHTLHEYAMLRADKCPFMETKTFCSNCKVHCYKKDMREKIREVMRYSGPRMIFYHPIMAIRHVLDSRKEKRRLENINEH